MGLIPSLSVSSVSLAAKLAAIKNSSRNALSPPAGRNFVGLFREEFSWRIIGLVKTPRSQERTMRTALWGKGGLRRGVYGGRVEIDRRKGSVRTLVELEAMLASISGFCGPVITKFKESVFKF